CKIMYISVTVISLPSIPGNMFILLKFAYIKIIERKLLPANIILTALALSNFLVILSRVIPQILNAIGVPHLLDDTECKLISFTFRVSRGMAICLTSFLSCHQCALVAPITKFWNYLKENLQKRLHLILLLLLVINITLYPSTVLYGRAKGNYTTSPYTLHLVYCTTDFLSYAAFMSNGMVSVIREFLFVGLMILSSIYMVTILYRHGNAMRGMRSSDKGNSKSMEYKASRAVILLVAVYVVLYGMDNSMWIYTLSLSNVSPETNDIRILLAAAYSAISPFVIIATNPKLQRRIQISWKKNVSEMEKQDVQNLNYVKSIS
uniref:Vomeronasal type-1 receptor n=1 Tax=Leptobrachium leishanense TaxID=445787 RepID=A0A8C5PC60_9ANUR